MKINIIHMVGALLSSAILTFSCADDDVPSYSEMTVDKNDLFIKIENHTAEVNITAGNGNYKVEVANEDIVTAQVDGNKIIFTALKNGRTTATVTDWAKHSSIINIRVKEDFKLELEKSELSLFKYIEGKSSELIYIRSGNDGYKIKENDNENAVEAIITENNKVKITSLGKGTANIIITDDDGKEFSLKVISYEYDLTLDEIPSIWKTNTDKTINIKTGNGGYEASSDNGDIAEAIVVYDTENPDNCSIKITGKAAGETNILIKDEMGLSVPVKVNVKNPMSVSATSIDELILGGETKDIIITDGSGIFECSGTKVEGSISEDGTKVTLKGTTIAGYTQGAMLTLKDKEFGESITIKVNKVDQPFLETQTIRYNIGGWIANTGTSKKSISDGKNKISMGDEEKNWIGRPTGKIIYGYNLYFSDEIKVGDITNDVKLMHIGEKGDQEDKEIGITNLKIEKMEDGWTWFTFEETEHPEFGKSYLVVKI